MKGNYKSRRHRNPQQQGENEKKAIPFFSKDNHTPFFNTGVQTKLSLGKPGDKYEKEADGMADAVVNNSKSKPLIQNKEISSVQRESLASPQEDEKLGTAEQRMEEDKLVQEKPIIQKEESPEEEEMLNMKEKPEEEEMINKMEEEEEETMQAKSDNPSQVSAQNLPQQLKSKSGKGKTLAKPIKAEMETSFGTDFSDVKIHTDAEAVDMNKSLNAQAFTYGRNVFFNSGKYDPGSTKGKHLLAHELTHVVQQNASKKIQREAETDAAGNYTNNYIFRQNAFFRRVKRAVSDGPLTDDEIASLKADAIQRNGTVQHAELLLMAAMRNPVNVAALNAHTTGNLIISMTAISTADRDHVMNVGRERVPLDIQLLRFRRFLAALGLSPENTAALDSEIEIRVFEEIAAAGGNAFRSQADKIVVHLTSGSSVAPVEVLTAMLNAASDNTAGDKVMAGIAYMVAREYNHPMASRLLQGDLKVDALIPSVYRRLLGGGDAQYQYSTDNDLRKADTLYLPTNLDLFQITDKALIIHELTHAEDDFSSQTDRSVNSIDLEMNAYRAQSKYIMDQIRALPSGSAPGLVSSGSDLANSDPTHYWGYISAAKANVSTYTTVLNEILTSPPTSKTSGEVSTDLGNSITVIDANLRNAISNMKDTSGRNLYNPASNTRLEGASGHFFH